MYSFVEKQMLKLLNEVAEATFKMIKTEFVKGRHFDRLEEVTREFYDYVH